MQCLDKKSLLFVRSYKGDGPAAWKALCDRFRSFVRPRLQQFFEKLTSLKTDQKGTIVDCIPRAEDLQYNLSQVDEALSDQMFVSILLKGLRKEFETFCALVKFTMETKGFEEVKRDLINFDTDRRKPRVEETTFLSRNDVKVISVEDQGTSHLSVQKKHEHRPSKPRISDNLASVSNAVSHDMTRKIADPE